MKHTRIYIHAEKTEKSHYGEFDKFEYTGSTGHEHCRVCDVFMKMPLAAVGRMTYACPDVDVEYSWVETSNQREKKTYYCT